jgi:prevent-host-death family protein
MAKYGTIRELQARATELIKSTRTGEPLIVTSRGKPVAVLTAVSPDDADRIALLMERITSYEAYKTLQQQAASKAGMTQRQIDALIKKIRKKQ